MLCRMITCCHESRAHLKKKFPRQSRPEIDKLCFGAGALVHILWAALAGKVKVPYHHY
jgi:hypothetical protein